MIQTLSLFRPLNQKLLEVLTSLDRTDWERKTLAGAWTVKDVAAHLLDGSIRQVSRDRDAWMVSVANKPASYRELVDILNRMNADWVQATKRVSPQILLSWLNETHESYVTCLERLDLQAPSQFSVAWAGEETSFNWFHIAREYTEKWHHQQQIREAVGRDGIRTKEFYHPVLDTFIQALPFQYKDVSAVTGTQVILTIDSDAGGAWTIEKDENQWTLKTSRRGAAITEIFIPADLAWKLFTKAVKFENVKQSISITGDKSYAMPALHMISVMA